MNADGSNQTNVSNTAFQELYPSLSPDGTRIVFTSMRDGNSEIYIMNEDGTGQTRLTNTLNSNISPSFSPDGTKITFISDRTEAGIAYVFVMNADGTNQTRVTTPIQHLAPFVPVFSPDGTKILIESAGYNMHLINVDGTGDVVLAANAGDGVSHPNFSPDGSKIVFSQSNQGLFIMNADGTGRTALATPGRASDPSFSPHGTQIAFTSKPLQSNDADSRQPNRSTGGRQEAPPQVRSLQHAQTAASAASALPTNRSVGSTFSQSPALITSSTAIGTNGAS